MEEEGVINMNEIDRLGRWVVVKVTEGKLTSKEGEELIDLVERIVVESNDKLTDGIEKIIEGK